MRRLATSCLALTTACTSGGTVVVLDAGSDVGPDVAWLDAGEAGDALEAAPAPDGAPPCLAIDGGAPSDDCVPVGRCPAGCGGGTASAYACNPSSGAAFPAALAASSGVSVITAPSTPSPWDGGTTVACGPLVCTRWSTGDHGASGSAWSSDPCGAPAADGAAPAATLAWACPPAPGVVPAGPGCAPSALAAGLGGADAGFAAPTVWCCPPPGDGG